MLFSHIVLIPLSKRQGRASLWSHYVHKDSGAQRGLKFVQGHTAGQGQSLDEDPGPYPAWSGYLRVRVEQDREEGRMEKGTCRDRRHRSSQTCHPPGRISPPALLSPSSCKGKERWFPHNQRLQQGVPVLACGMHLSGLVHSLLPVRPAGSFPSVRGLGRVA